MGMGMRLSLLPLLLSGVSVLGGFAPAIESVELSHRLLRPGDRAMLKVTFVNRGADVADSNLRIFTHLEDAEKRCGDIRGHYDHEPTDVPTSLWQPGARIEDGPIMVGVPANSPEGTVVLHLGLFDATSGHRLIDHLDPIPITISRQAPKAQFDIPQPLPDDEARRRHHALASGMDDAPLRIDTPAFRLRARNDGSRLWLQDRQTGEVWNHAAEAPFGRVSFIVDDKPHVALLTPFDSAVQETPTRFTLTRNLADGLTVTILCEATPDQRGLRLAARQNAAAPNRSVTSVELLRHAFITTNNDHGASTIGFRCGERFVATQAKQPGQHAFTTYNYSSTMAMMGQEKNGSALLLAWAHPDTSYSLDRRWTQHPQLPGTVVHSLGLTLRSLDADCTVYPLGKGSYVDIAKAYRHHVQQRGLLKTWRQKTDDDGVSRTPMHGCADFKPFVYTHTVPSSRYNHSGKDERHVNWTLPEIGDISEHLHHDLGIDRAMMVLCGWINGGYDNGHPDPLPVAPELGGNPELQKLAERIHKTGFLFGLHDNYQDMYEAAPSWNPAFVAKDRNGNRMAGGNWAGGPCWLVCADKQLELAARPDTNLPKIAQLFKPSIYFIDTIFAAPLYTCHDPAHPNSRTDDLNNKIKLCQLGSRHFGRFGSEEGREWAVPYADYFEGVFSHRANFRTPGTSFHSTLGGQPIPLLEMVFGDCVNLYTHQSDRATPGRDHYILACIANAETPLYDFGAHLYFKRGNATQPAALQLNRATATPNGNRSVTLNVTWTALADLHDAKMRSYVHFCHPNGNPKNANIAFQDDHDLPTQGWKRGETRTVSRTITIPDGFDANIDWRVGVLDAAITRQQFLRPDATVATQAHLGTLAVTPDGTVSLTPPPALNGRLDSSLARADNGWAADLNETDRFIKNTYEVTSWLARLAADSPMTDHRFLNDDGTIEQTQFGDLSIWINESSTPYVVDNDQTARLGGPVELPPNGFLALSPTFIAFHALSFGGHAYPRPALFTLRALDDAPLTSATAIRVFHAFGDDTLLLNGKQHHVTREAVIHPLN